MLNNNDQLKLVGLKNYFVGLYKNKNEIKIE